MITLHTGDCIEVMRQMEAHSIDAIVTDPPYGLKFMGKQWDHGTPGVQYWREAMRVAKPGAYLLAFGGTRTFHRLMVAIEDAGWELRDTIGWIYGQGFPKSHNGEWGGTALKPAWEPIVMARKPLVGTVEQNHARYGTGGLSIDACRIEGAKGGGVWGSSNKTVNPERTFVASPGAEDFKTEPHAAGRWPANLAHDGSDEVLAVFPSEAGASAPVRGTESSDVTRNAYSARDRVLGAFHGDTGSAARFFYCPKASRSDRNDGCEHMEKKPLNWSSGAQSPGTFQAEGTDRSANNSHPTVKPTNLMRWLVRLVTPKGGIVLDPFMGSGSTGRAAILEGMRFTGIELSAEYVSIATARIEAAAASLTSSPSSS